MTELRQASPERAAEWQDDWGGRLRAWYRRAEGPAEWTDEIIGRRIAMQAGNETAVVLSVISGEDEVGVVALAAFPPPGPAGAMLNNLWIAPDCRRRGHGREALCLAEDWARSQDARGLWLLADPADPAHAALFAGYPARAQQMIKTLSAPGRLPAGVTGRGMAPPEFGDWYARSVREYATEIAGSGSATAEEAARSSEEQHAQILPEGLRTPGHSFLCLEAGGAVVATNWILHHRWPEVSWVYGVEVSEGQRGKGYGRAAMDIGERATLNAGDQYLALNVFGQNAVAIGMYEAMGYRAYDQGRSAGL